MKNLYIIMISLFFINNYSQTYPLNTLLSELPNGGYAKDLDDVFQPYLGIWTGTWDNKEFKLELVKINQHLVTFPNGDYYYQDRVVGKYIITDILTNNTLFTTMNAVNYDEYKIYGLVCSNNIFKLMFTDSICLNSLAIRLSLNPSNTNQLLYSAIYDDWNYIDCPYQDRLDIPVPIPVKLGLVLTKQ